MTTGVNNKYFNCKKKKKKKKKKKENKKKKKKKPIVKCAPWDESLDLIAPSLPVKFSQTNE